MTDPQPSAATQMLGGFADKLVDLTDDVLLGDAWQRPELPARDRSLVTITALVAGGIVEQLRFPTAVPMAGAVIVLTALSAGALAAASRRPHERLLPSLRG